MKLLYVAYCFFWLLWATPSRAQVVPNRDSAEYYFQRGASFYEDRRQPIAWRSAGRRWAMKNYTKSIAFDSSYYWSYRNLGYCYQNFGEYELALANYNRAVLAGNRSGEADAAHVHFDCIEICLRLEKWQEAEVHCSSLLANTHLCTNASDDFCQNVWLNRAKARVHLKKYAEARQDYLVYQAQIEAELAAEAKKLADTREEFARQAMPKHLTKSEQAMFIRGRDKYLKEQEATVNTLKSKSTTTTHELANLTELLR